MTSSSTPASASDLQAAVIADAATRLAILRRLADLGMRLAEEVCERAIAAPYHPELRHEPARAFAAVSRAVRLTLVLQVKMEALLVALRNGEAVSIDTAAVACAKRESDAAGHRAAAEDIPGDAAGGSDPSRETLREHESERFDELASGSLDDCIAAIRADLGLEPGDAIPSEEDSVDSALGNVLGAAVPPSIVHDTRVPTGAITGVGALAALPPNTG